MYFSKFGKNIDKTKNLLLHFPLLSNVDNSQNERQICMIDDVTCILDFNVIDRIECLKCV